MSFVLLLQEISPSKNHFPRENTSRSTRAHLKCRPRPPRWWYLDLKSEMLTSAQPHWPRNWKWSIPRISQPRIGTTTHVSVLWAGLRGSSWFPKETANSCS